MLSSVYFLVNVCFGTRSFLRKIEVWYDGINVNAFIADWPPIHNTFPQLLSSFHCSVTLEMQILLSFNALINSFFGCHPSNLVHSYTVLIRIHSIGQLFVYLCVLLLLLITDSCNVFILSSYLLKILQLAYIHWIYHHSLDLFWCYSFKATVMFGLCTARFLS